MEQDIELKLEKISELSQEAVEIQKKLKLEKVVLDELKEEIKNEYLQLKEDTINLDEEFHNIKINSYILQEKKHVNYTWLDEFYEEAIDCGFVHTLIKHGNKLKERFDLSEYELPKDPENKSLNYRPQQKMMDEQKKEEEWVNAEVEKWQAETLEAKVERYMRYKKLYKLKEDRYSAQKSELLEAMKETGIEKTSEGFYLKDETTQYDFKRLYNSELEETVLIATNGTKSVDLFYDKKIVEVDILEDDLNEAERIKKRFGKGRMEALEKVLSNDFYFVKGYRTEKEILKRFPVSTEKVEDAIDNGYLPFKVLETGRTIKSIDDLKLNFEILSEESVTKRGEVFQQRFMDRALKHSGYYDDEQLTS